jgi:uncharacterized protein (TIGR00369 family)
MPKTRTPAHPFEPEFVDLIRTMFEERIVFNRVLGLKLTSFNPEHALARIDMREDLIGHFLHRRLHGGVISATLDAMGGFAVMLGISARHLDEPPESRLTRFSKLGTIDLRVDYLRPATGPHFVASAHAIRLGSRVATTRMELHDSEDRLVSAGTAAYIVS